MLKFYYHPTPNPMKVALFLAETGIPFELVPVDTAKGEQHLPEFRAVNPNGKLPAIVDDGAAVFDSTAILIYLSEKTGQFGVAPQDRGALLSWLMFIGTGLGPFSGQSVHFHHAAPEDVPYAKNRYMREIERHYQVLNDHLKGRDFIVGDSYSIADISAWGWVARAPRVLGPDALAAFPEVARWFDSINSRPAVKVAEKIAEGVSFKTPGDEASMRALYPSNFAAA
ncbi:glutathione S-transferase N-terminal domain-containing protein [Paracoccus sp. MBLB3053]|uniref:Glutathione S-transferase N-terminal domain-containing protein n=1 Tax=Paracoccus aurantius TaxID=3073814 RepID=A0ABU2HUV0_9RHOB|nr:glutathione S-transferase N-terminal domain-containing protein [Paracoccus sp. MBLB3053]MDS9468824.1 glutathione S-transferase N-terminal domain-containing protein [Paracoccus sp. MBLB3053]